CSPARPGWSPARRGDGRARGRVARLDGEGQLRRRTRGEVEPRAGVTAEARGGGGQRVSGPDLVDGEVGERGHAAARRPGERAGEGSAAGVAPQRHGDAGGGAGQVAEGVLDAHLHRRRDGGGRGGARRLHREGQLRGRGGADGERVAGGRERAGAGGQRVRPREGDGEV